MKSPVKTAVGDVLISFMWAFVSSSFGLLTYLIASAAGVQTVAWAPLVIITLIFFVFISIFNIIGAVLGGASFDPTATAAFYAAGVSDDTLISMALRLPAQAAGAVGGTMAIMEAIPEQYKHLIGGPSLKVDTHTGAIAEGVLTFVIAFAVLLIILRGPQSPVFKTCCGRNISNVWLCLHRTFHESCICLRLGICIQAAQHMGSFLCLLDLSIHRNYIGCVDFPAILFPTTSESEGIIKRVKKFRVPTGNR